MRRIKLTLEFDGTDFFGWQVQAGAAHPVRTVQGVLEAALATLPGARPKAHAAGRTDAGVHALAMVAHYDTDDRIPVAKVPAALNARLPPDVRVLHAEEVPRSFEAQFSCCYRRYLYRMRLLRASRAGSALERRRVLFVPGALDLEAMQRAAPRFEGTRDFAALATQESRTTVRTVYRCRLGAAGPDLTLDIAADGFLRNMVRAVVGTLLWVGEGKLAPEDVSALLAARDRRRAGPNAPPHGLYFAEAGYEPWGTRAEDAE
ncbi:tRNA pseudouridine(38-40) synthase TruA [Truepera radiovictrix]|uniref:tRNA pseudouridine synthase A n=1 Tax=Truepera radiovictrix (strain DSM 17093 / CIP 108686 / LMG 22925 / RQ-24) TaxID=649638 RepID=D7CU58_TRURR|nr:tRNA pseudouridine(38-40) synthase TruA [Truepera radiovictrix]ADI13956.1 tRNA pseudouridine synthase A [Truepera radiovictrix DSM 17093]WMT57480.1 tRNA pseudouridine(38-40) synthase TruA [Truepera radiovictrix]